MKGKINSCKAEEWPIRSLNSQIIQFYGIMPDTGIWKEYSISDLVNTYFKINASYLINAPLYAVRIVLDAPL